MNLFIELEVFMNKILIIILGAIFALSLWGDDGGSLSRNPNSGKDDKKSTDQAPAQPPANDANKNSGSQSSFGGKSGGGAPAKALGKIVVSDRKIILEAWDNATEDGDRVDISLNDNPPIKNFSLTNAKKKLNLVLKSGENNINVKALNEGSASPNTAAFRVICNGKVVIEHSWDLKTNEIGNLKVYWEAPKE
ncbi:MAG: hypothetical protein RR060_06660 [Victivallaceae bacterium]